MSGMGGFCPICGERLPGKRDRHFENAYQWREHRCNDVKLRAIDAANTRAAETGPSAADYDYFVSWFWRTEGDRLREADEMTSDDEVINPRNKTR